MSEEMSQHQQEVCQTLSPTGRRLFGLIEFDDQEQMLLEIRKSPVGLAALLIAGATFIIFVFVIAYFVNMSLSNGLLSRAGGYGAAIYGIALLLSGLIAVGILLSVIVFINDVIFITNEKIAQVLYKNVITRKVSQLGMGDVQDVTVSQKGIFARLFNYGTLVIETAGEQDNYIFTYVPQPTHASRVIISAHEEYVGHYGN